MKKIIFFLLFICIGALGYLTYWYFTDGNFSNSTNTTDLSKKAKEKKGEVKSYPLKDYYVFEKEDLVFVLEVYNAVEGTFNGQLSSYYIEDLFKEANVIDKQWEVNGKIEEENTWSIRLSETKFDNFNTTIEVSKNKVMFAELPILEEEIELKPKDKLVFDFEKKKKDIYKLYSEKLNRISVNQFSNVEHAELESVMNEHLNSYPKNSDGSLTTYGITRLHIHREYLEELSKRIERNFSLIDTKNVELANYLKKYNPKNDSYFEDNALKLFGELNDINDQNEQYLASYSEFVITYEVPNETRDSMLDLKDVKTQNLINEIVKKYSRTNISIYNTTTNKQKNNLDNEYGIFSKMLTENK